MGARHTRQTVLAHGHRIRTDGLDRGVIPVERAFGHRGLHAKPVATHHEDIVTIVTDS
jgi:hypothetical protein